MNDLEIIGERLRKIRTERNESLGDVAKITGLTKGILSKYERGLVDPGLRTITKLIRYYNVSLDWVLGFTEDSKPIVSFDPFSGLNDENKRIAKDYIRFLGGKKGPELAAV